MSEPTDATAVLEATIAEHQPEDVGSNCICGSPYPCEIKLMAEEARERLRRRFPDLAVSGQPKHMKEQA